MKKAAKKGAPKKAKAAASPDWRRETLARVRALIKEAAPGATEEAKWKKATNPAGVPTWSQDGIICTGETYKDKVKLTFARGASLKDPAKLFNAADTGATRRAIDIRGGDTLNERAFKGLVAEAVALNGAKKPVKKASVAKKSKRA
jgi:hypothetical protein